MAPPSQLSIATSSVMRLIKEESSYHKELQQQETRLETLKKEGGDENFEYTMKQQVRQLGGISNNPLVYLHLYYIQEKAIRETRAIFPELKEKIMQAVANLELQLVR